MLSDSPEELNAVLTMQIDLCRFLDVSRSILRKSIKVSGGEAHGEVVLAQASAPAQRMEPARFRPAAMAVRVAQPEKPDLPFPPPPRFRSRGM